MAVDLKSMTANQLLSLRNDIDMRLADMARELEKQLVQIRGISLSKRGPTFLRKRGPLVGGKVAPKYRDRGNPSQTWAGRGKRPKWLTDALKSGRKLESFAVKR